MVQTTAQTRYPQTGGQPPGPERDMPRATQAYAPGFGVYPWEPRSFARDRYDPLRKLEEDAENG